MFTQQHRLTVQQVWRIQRQVRACWVTIDMLEGTFFFHFRTLSCDIVCSRCTCYKSCLIPLNTAVPWAWTTNVRFFMKNTSCASWHEEWGVLMVLFYLSCQNMQPCRNPALQLLIFFFFSLLIALTWSYHWMRVSSHTCWCPLQVNTFKLSHSESVWSQIFFPPS